MRLSISSDIDSEISRRTVPPNRRRCKLELDRFQQVIRLVGDLEIGVPRDAERRAFGDLHLREERASAST